MTKQDATNAATPKQMLELAKICEPGKRWAVSFDDVVLVVARLRYGLEVKSASEKFDPLNNDAQLMQVVFALWEKSAIKVETIEHDSGKYFEAELVGFQWGITNSAYGRTKQQAILNLAVEVLL